MATSVSITRQDDNPDTDVVVLVHRVTSASEARLRRIGDSFHTQVDADNVVSIREEPKEAGEPDPTASRDEPQLD